ncbi:MAG TPA: EamA family transporter [Actinomycetota bacterium]|nr:EamA family transporter [Actinomycetota bacterium]
MRFRRADLVGVGVVTVAGCCYAAATIAIKLAYRQQAGTGLVAWIRFAGAALVLWGLARMLRVARRPEPRKLRSLVVMGLVASVVGGLFVGSLERIPASASTLLLYAHPAMVALATAALGRERWGLGKGVALGLSTVGLVLVLGTPAAELDWVGVGMALGAAVALATFIVLAQRAVAAVHPLVSSGIVQGTAAFAFAPVAVATGAVHPGRIPVSLGWMVAVALFTAAALALFLSAVDRLGPTRASIGATVEPVVTVILGVVVLGESLTGIQLLGGALVVAAVAILPLVEHRAVAATDLPPVGRPTGRES